MGASREGANIWHDIRFVFKYPFLLKRWFTLRYWRGPVRSYGWHDSFGRYIAQLLVCPIRGHRLSDIEDDNDKPILHCFRCECHQPFPPESQWYNWQYRLGHKNGYALGFDHGRREHSEGRIRP